jgi:enoyl-CoA hydratase/carnithine racemase
MRPQSESAGEKQKEVIAEFQREASGAAVLRLTLNRPAKRNALNLSALEQLHRGLEQRADIIILTGKGPSFCAGLDLDECRRDPNWPRPRRHLELLGSVYGRLLASEARILALVQGFAVGGGVGLAACADAVIASGDARLRIPQGALAPLARIVHPVIEARQIFRCGTMVWPSGELDVHAARACGLVDEILEPHVFANLREQGLRELRPRVGEVDSWRQPAQGRAVLEAMRAILTELSR